MWPRITGLLLCFVAIGVPPSASAQSSRTGAGCQETRTLPTRQKWARFAMVQGRVTAIVAHGQSGSLSCEDPDEGRMETFGVHATPEAASVRYTFRSPHETTSYHFDGSDQLTIDRAWQPAETPGHDPAPARRLIFTQHPLRGIEVVVEEADVGPAYYASSWWHLLLTEPELAKQEVLPLLERLRSDWQLELQGEQIESLLLEHPLGDSAPPLEDLVARLADGRFEVRRQADRQLRTIGPRLLPFLDQLDPRQLSAEQVERIRSLREGLVPPGEDTPHRVAGWLSYDARLGEPWLRSPDSARQLFARRQLARLEHPRSLNGAQTEAQRVAQQPKSLR